MGKYKTKSKRPRENRRINEGRRNVADWEERDSADEVGINPAGDYKQRRTAKTHGGEYACLGRRNTSRFREACPVCISKMKSKKKISQVNVKQI